MRAFYLATLSLALGPIAASCASGGSAPDDNAPVFDTGGASGAGGGDDTGGHAHSGAAGVGGSGGGMAGTGGAAGASGAGGDVAGGAGMAGESGSSGAGGSGGSGGLGGAAGAGGGSAGGDGGAVGTGGSAGASGSAGDAGAAGSGTAGAGGSASGGAGGKGGGGPIDEPTLVVIAAGATGNGTLARFSASGGWETVAAPLSILGRPAIASRGTSALVAARLTGGTSIAWATWDGVVWSGPTTVDASAAIDGPALAVSGATAVLGYLGVETPSGILYASRFSGGAFPEATAMGPPASPPFAKSAAELVLAGGVTYGIFSGENEGLYYATDDGTGFTMALPIQGAGAKAFITPGTAIDPKSLAPSVFYARNTDNQICQTSFVAGTWSAPSCVPDALTDRTPAVAITATKTIVAWHGYQGQGIFAATSSGASWSNVITIEAGTVASSAPAITTGIGGVDAEIVWSRGGVLRHARLTGDVPVVANAGATGTGELAAALLSP